MSEIPEQLRGIIFTFPPYLRHYAVKAPAEKYMLILTGKATINE